MLIADDLDQNFITSLERQKTKAEKNPTLLGIPAQDLSRRLNRMGDTASAGFGVEYERLMGTNDMVHISYLARGLEAARTVARLTVRSPDWPGAAHATGFLIAPRVLVTNHHVIADEETARRSFAEFEYELSLDGMPRTVRHFHLNPEEGFATVKEWDVTVVAVAPRSLDGEHAIEDQGYLPLIPQIGKIEDKEWITIVQHPQGQYKQISIRENQLISRTERELWYASDTAPGTSGAPAMNDQWQVVAVHSRGVPQTDKDGRIVLVTGKKIQREDLGKVPENLVKWVANAGIRVSRITRELTKSESCQAFPLLKELVESFDGMPPATGSFTGPVVRKPVPPPPSKPAVGPGNGAAGRGVAGNGTFENSPPHPDYGARNGYDPAFLCETIPLPELDGAKSRFGAPAMNRLTNDPELKYTNFSVVMSAQRRLAYFAATNIDGASCIAIERLGSDRWFYDPRISPNEQVGNDLYAEEVNFFDRGHIVKRLDPCWGTFDLALKGNDDTFHWTNCSPQHWRYNRGATLWKGLEDYVLDNLDGEDVKATVFTGPIFSESDYVHRCIPIPNQYWKLVIVRTPSDGLKSSAYIVSQEQFIERIDFEEFPVGQYRTFQTSVPKVEDLTGLRFADSVHAADVLRGTQAEEMAVEREIRRLSDIALN